MSHKNRLHGLNKLLQNIHLDHVTGHQAERLVMLHIHLYNMHMYPIYRKNV